MFMTQKFDIKKDERALLFRKGDFDQILEPGTHTFVDPMRRLTAEVFQISSTKFEHRIADYLLKAEPGIVGQHFHVLALGPNQVALRFENGVPVELHAPITRALFWKGHVDVSFEIVDITDQYEVEPNMARMLVRAAVVIQGREAVLPATVPAYHAGVLTVDGRMVRILEPGFYAFYRFNRDVQVGSIDLRLQAVDVAGQEILTRDKVALRVNLSATYQVTDVALALERQAKPVDFLYRELQYGLRAAVGTRTLDELLEDRGTIDAIVAAHIAQAVEGYGLTVHSVGVKDIILPGDMKTILARVVEAEKVAQANVIRRREETAATRSLLNTAKVMEDNPVALRLKELETLERITEKIDKISVFGGLDGVMKNLVTIQP